MKKIALWISISWLICTLNYAFAEQTLVNINTSQAKTPLNLPSLNMEKLKSGQQTLRVGHYNQLPPFYFLNADSQPGFGHDIFVEVAKKAGIPKIEFIGFDNSIDLNALLTQGKIDVIANSWDLPGMRKQFLLTNPYYTKGGLSFLYYKDKGSFQNADDLKDHTIGAFKGGYAARYWLPTHGISKNSIKTYTSLKELMFALRDGDVDVAVVYHPLALFAKRQFTDQFDVSLAQPINDVYAVRKQDNELQTTLDQAIQALATEGILDKIVSQYLDNSPLPTTQQQVGK